VIPLRTDELGMHLLAADPFNTHSVDDLTFALGRPVRLVVADPERVDALVRLHYGDEEKSIEQLVEELSANGLLSDSSSNVSAHDLETMAGQAPIIRFVNLVLAHAVRAHASDVHFEPFGKEFRIRHRIDGALHDLAPPPRQLALAVTSRLKVLANLNIAERRVPQDGRVKVSVGGRAVDLRVSTLPTQCGESVVLRVLDQSNVQLDIRQLGMPREVLQAVEVAVRKPNGIVVVTGPTGSGKTTTLYSALRSINQPELKLVTAEDPVEYEMEGVMQVSVNPQIGFTFASALRSFLRQDPDVIMVGEIRDAETAQIAIQASLTGHLVLSTLHTNDAAGAITRLIDMGIEPFLIASTLEAVLAQRLLRKLCVHCRTEYDPPVDLLEQAGVSAADIRERRFFRPCGCLRCDRTGYRGRVGIFEWLQLSEEMRELVVERAPTLRLKQQATAAGMRTLRESALAAALAGETSLEEMMRYT
jgi:type IV pilus assembly protein PilB